jgi:3-oxoacyl-(acyl-carrier-protein) synthase
MTVPVEIPWRFLITAFPCGHPAATAAVYPSRPAIFIFGQPVLTADKVLVTIGTPCSVSAVGSTETYTARVSGAPEFIAYAAFDAGLIDIDVAAEGSLALRWAQGEQAGNVTSLAEIEALHGHSLRAALGIRHIDELTALGNAAITDIAASLPHDFGSGGLRRQAGLRYRDVRESALKDMYGLFDDDPRLGPSLQAQLFVYSGIGALAALPVSLSELLRDPYDFRVAAATAFPGMDALHQWRAAGSVDTTTDKLRDRFAMRLANTLASHGPALVATMLAPSYPLSKSLKNPALLDSLRSANGFMRVPQTPLNAVGACASSSIALSEIAPQMLLDYPGFHRPQMVLWTAADAATRPHWQILDAFGSGALMTRTKLEALNAERPAAERRAVGDCLAPFDVDANGTVVGEGGSGVLITTLDFALRNFLDITSIIVGWGQSGEAGGKAHFAGVGFGGENAIMHALDIAWRAHGYGVSDFDYLAAHATGTRTNSKTDLTTAANARNAAAARQGHRGALPQMKVGTPKAVGDGHTMGETGLKSAAQAIQYLLGKPAVGVPTLRHLDPDLSDVATSFVLERAPFNGNPDGGALCATQGFGGYNGAIALRAAHADAFRRYSPDRNALAAYLERWPELRRERETRERAARLSRRSTLELATLHAWKGLD